MEPRPDNSYHIRVPRAHKRLPCHQDTATVRKPDTFRFRYIDRAPDLHPQASTLTLSRLEASIQPAPARSIALPVHPVQPVRPLA